MLMIRAIVRHEKVDVILEQLMSEGSDQDECFGTRQAERYQDR